MRLSEPPVQILPSDAPDEEQYLFLCPNLETAARWVDSMRNEGCVMSDLEQFYRNAQFLNNQDGIANFKYEVRREEDDSWVRRYHLAYQQCVSRYAQDI